MTTVKIPKGDYTVSLRMDRAAESYARYEATLVTPERLVASQTNLAPSPAGAAIMVVFTLPFYRRVAGVYILNLKGGIPRHALDDLDDYTFQVIDK